MDELVTIIVPVYNGEDFIERCLKSLLKQDYSNIEIIIINDGSQDKSLSIINKFLNNDNVKVFSQINQGVSKARNLGLNQSRGKYIRFVDADDFLPHDSISKMVSSFTLGVALVCGNSQHYNHMGEKLDNKKNKKLGSKVSLGRNKAIDTLLIGDPKHGVCDKLFLSDIILENNISFDSEIFNFEDLLFTMEYLSKGNNGDVIFLGSCVYNYTESLGSATRSGLNHKQLTFIKSFESMKNVIAEENRRDFYKLYLYLLLEYSIKLQESKEILDSSKSRLRKKFVDVYDVYAKLGGHKVELKIKNLIVFCYYHCPRISSFLISYSIKLRKFLKRAY